MVFIGFFVSSMGGLWRACAASDARIKGYGEKVSLPVSVDGSPVAERINSLP
jgi:hypothetical protein